MKFIHSLKFKIVSTICAVVALVLFVVLFLALTGLYKSAIAGIRENQTIIIEALVQVATPALFMERYPELEGYLQQIAKNEVLIEAVVWNSDYQVIASSDPAGIGLFPENLNIGSEKQYWVTQEIPGAIDPLGVVGLLFSSKPQLAAKQRAWAMGAGIAGPGLILVLLVSVTMAHLLTKQLNVINESAVRIGNGQFRSRTGLVGKDEIGDLGRAFDAMSDRLVSEMEAVQASELKFRTLVENTPICIAEINLAGIVLSMNSTGIRILQITVDDQGTQSHYLDVVCPADQKRVEQLFLLAAQGVPQNFEFLDFNERHHQSLFVPILEEDGSVERVIGFSDDITERLELTQKQRQLYQRLQLAMDNGKVRFWDWQFKTNTIHRVSTTNSPGDIEENESGIKLAELMVLAHPDDRNQLWAATNASPVHPESPLELEFRVKQHDDSYSWVKIRGDLQYDDAGKAAHMLGTVIDINELKQVQLQLRKLVSVIQTVREEERTVIAREMHDELGQSLTGLHMDLAWILKQLPAVADKDLVQHVEGALQLVDHTVNLVQKMSLELRPAILDDLGLAAVVEWQVRKFQERFGGTCTLHIDLGDIEVDEERDIAVFRILQESLTNVARHAHASEVAVSLEANTGYLCMEIADNGIGVPEEKLMGIGSIGLLGMRERASALGGNLEVIRVPAGGTAIRLNLPV